jgi:hypothetical protein
VFPAVKPAIRRVNNLTNSFGPLGRIIIPLPAFGVSGLASWNVSSASDSTGVIYF